MKRTTKPINIPKDFKVGANTHSFNVSLATALGLTEAILLQHFKFWHDLNNGNEDMIKEGRTWFFLSFAKINEIYPYLPVGQIRGAITRLIDSDLVYKSDFNADKFIKTTWYSLSDSALTILEGITNSTVCQNNTRFAKITHDLSKSQIGLSKQHIDSNNIDNKNIYNNNIYRKEIINNNINNKEKSENIAAEGKTPYQILDSIEAKLLNEETWKESITMKYGVKNFNQAFIDFRTHITGIGKLDGIKTEADYKQYFFNACKYCLSEESKRPPREWFAKVYIRDGKKYVLQETIETEIPMNTPNPPGWNWYWDNSWKQWRQL